MAHTGTLGGWAEHLTVPCVQSARAYSGLTVRKQSYGVDTHAGMVAWVCPQRKLVVGTCSGSEGLPLRRFARRARLDILRYNRMPLTQRPPRAQTSNIMHLEARPFDPVTFEKEEEAYEDEVTGEVKVRLRDESTIRWRIVPDGEGTIWRMLLAKTRFAALCMPSWHTVAFMFLSPTVLSHIRSMPFAALEASITCVWDVQTCRRIGGAITRFGCSVPEDGPVLSLASSRQGASGTSPTRGSCGGRTGRGSCCWATRCWMSRSRTWRATTTTCSCATRALSRHAV